MPAHSRIPALLVLLTCLLPAHPGWAQVPGYLGRKTIVGVQTGMFPNLWQSIQNNQPVALNVQGGIQAEHVLNRRFSVGASAQYLSTQSFYNTDQVSGTMTLSGAWIGADFRAYMVKKKGNLPPLGPHHRFGIAFLDYVVNDNNLRYRPDGRKRLGHYQAGLISYTLAANRVWFDRLVTTTGVGASWVVSFSPTTFPEQDNFIWGRSTSRLRWFFAGQVVLGVGWLL